MDQAYEIARRAQESHLDESILRAVYLRGVRESGGGGLSVQQSALSRVDRFIVYALVRDTSYAEDRDLVAFVSPS